MVRCEHRACSIAFRVSSLCSTCVGTGGTHPPAGSLAGAPLLPFQAAALRPSPTTDVSAAATPAVAMMIAARAETLRETAGRGEQTTATMTGAAPPNEVVAKEDGGGVAETGVEGSRASGEEAAGWRAAGGQRPGMWGACGAGPRVAGAGGGGEWGGRRKSNGTGDSGATEAAAARSAAVRGPAAADVI